MTLLIPSNEIHKKERNKKRKEERKISNVSRKY